MKIAVVGAIVLKDVPSGVVVAGSPAKIIKLKDAKIASKIEILKDLR